MQTCPRWIEGGGVSIYIYIHVSTAQGPLAGSGLEVWRFGVQILGLGARSCA